MVLFLTADADEKEVDCQDDGLLSCTWAIGCHLIAVDIGDSCGHGDSVIAVTAVTDLPLSATESVSVGVQTRTRICNRLVSEEQFCSFPSRPFFFHFHLLSVTVTTSLPPSRPSKLH
jgi:hypothetical protein